MKPAIVASALVFLVLGSFFVGLTGSWWAPGWFAHQPPLVDPSPHRAAQPARPPAVSDEDIRRLREGLEAANARVMETELRVLRLQKLVADLAISVEALTNEKRAAVWPSGSSESSGLDRRGGLATKTVDGEEDDESLINKREDGIGNSWFVHLGTFETEAQALAIAGEAALLLGTRPQVFATNGPLWTVRLCQLDTQVSAQEAVNTMRRARISESSWIGRGCGPR